MTKNKRTRQSDITIEQIPNIISIGYIDKIDWQYMVLLKEFSNMKDSIISKWFCISESAIRRYREPSSQMKVSTKEHLLHLLILYKKANEIFISIEEFTNWLLRDNFYYDSKAPSTFLNSFSGVKLVLDRIVGMEYGDNA